MTQASIVRGSEYDLTEERKYMRQRIEDIDIRLQKLGPPRFMMRK